MSKAKRKQLQAIKQKQRGEKAIPRYEAKVTFDEETISEKAAIITALMKQSEETKEVTLSIANKGISLIRFPKETLLTIFEIVVPNALPDSAGVQELCKSFAETIQESNTVVFQLHK